MKVLLVEVSFFLGGDQKNFLELCAALQVNTSIEIAAAVNAGPLMDALIARGIQTYPLNMRFEPTHKRGFFSSLSSLFHTPTPISQIIADFTSIP